MIHYNKNLVQNARNLRKNMTPEETRLWYDLLKKLPFNVRRQHNIENYIVDFYIAAKKIVIEVDGIQHTSPEAKQYDNERSEVLKKWGIRVLRYSNDSINKEFRTVARSILNALGLDYSDFPPPKN